MALLRIDISGVDFASGEVADAALARVPDAEITAAAADPASVGVAQAVGTRIAILGAATIAVNGLVDRAGARLKANAADYAAQESANEAGLRSGATLAEAALTSAAVAPAMPDLAPGFPAPQSATAPTSGKHIAALIHGGPGPEPLLAAAQRLCRHADQLRDAGSHLRTANGNLDASWFSGASDAAQERIRRIAAAYESQADTATLVATHATSQADNVSRARLTIPRPEEFDLLEKRLDAAVRANAASGGAYRTVVADLQAQLATLHAKASTGYAEYSSGAATALDAPLAPADDEVPSDPDDVIVGEDQGDPDVRMAGWGNSPLPLTPKEDPLIPPAPGAQPQIGPFPVPPEVAAAAGPALSTVNPDSPVDKMLLPGQGSPVPGGTPLDPLFEQLLAPAPSGVLTPDQIKALVTDEVQRQMTDAQRFSFLDLLNKAAKGCVIGGAAAGLATIIIPPSEVVSIPGGCVGGAFTNSADYLWDQASK